MKKFFMLFFAVSLLSMMACSTEKSGESEDTTEGAEQTEFEEQTGKVAIYNFDATQSYMTWKATKAIGSSHHGKVKVQDGRLAVDGGNIYGGEATIDMTSLTVEDEDATSTEKLTGHLKSADFFDVDQFPFAKFTVVQIQPADGSEGYNFTFRGDLRIKDVTKTVTVPASVSITSDKVTMKSPVFTINRTEWGINYNSGILGTVADNIINDDIELSINIVANRSN
ncbi:MAG: YceI family protein [Saprospiraceae bacterium]|nr:YceI family protein [Saprospiraceae bacterium]